MIVRVSVLDVLNPILGAGLTPGSEGDNHKKTLTATRSINGKKFMKMAL